MMIDHILHYTAPAAYSLLPPAMHSMAATSFVIAAGLQESRFKTRRQMGAGTALSFWQFERAGVQGVLTHARSKAHVEAALRALCYGGLVREASACHRVIEHHDTLAFVLARLLLWTLPVALPQRSDVETAWTQYLDLWRPGKPHPETWAGFFADAWDYVEAERLWRDGGVQLADILRKDAPPT